MHKLKKYDLAISFAGEQREIAKTFATRLDASGYSIFYDSFFEAELLGSDLPVVLHNTYSSEARFVLILLSKEYLDKPWTNHERRAAIQEFIRRNGQGLLLLKIDDIELPGYSSDMGYSALKTTGQEKFYQILLKKLGQPSQTNQITHLINEDVILARKVIESCFRRAIFSSMDSEISLPAMYKSIERAIGSIHQIIPNIIDQELQFICLKIVKALDRIDRTKFLSVSRSDQLPVDIRTDIDSDKREVLRLLLEIRRAAKISIQLPFEIKFDHFAPEHADEQPSLV
ncbi:TIR domain-containing protein [Dyadobacter endophyticus]|uniref:TIR domain-containing protein n=1 Tax=Dyadobacter endophyticus TaxID=1749036 RepID=UPI003CF3A3E9